MLNTSFAQEAPFGLYWGENLSKLKSRGLSLEELTKDGSLVFYQTKQTPKDLSIAERYLLVIHDDYGLQKIVASSEKITNDITGSDGKKTYEQIKRAINEKYGAPKEFFEFSGRKLYKDHDEFYQCLKYDGCGAWISYWDLGTRGAIAVQLKGVSRGVGSIVLTYEGPNWSKGLREAREAKSLKDKGAL